MRDAFAHCEALVREADKDRFLSALFAPPEARGALHALYAFDIEIARVRGRIRDPLAGEIRLQWWADALIGEGRGEVDSNPVASALRAAAAKHHLPGEALVGLIDAHRFDLYDEPMQTVAELDHYGLRTASALIGLAARILVGDAAPGLEGLARPAGLALTFAGLLKAFPWHAKRGQLYLPLEVLARHGARRDDIGRQSTTAWRGVFAEMRGLARGHLAQARERMHAAPAEVVPALLPVALVRPLLDRMERDDYEPFAALETPLWRRQWQLWRAARRPERIFG